MKKPLLMRMAPAGCRTWLYYHLYRSRRPQLRALFDDAELAFAPGVRMKLLPTDEGHGCIATAGFYELPLTRTIARLGKQGGLMVDVGANYGYFSLLWAAQKPGNRVIAFEASPRNQQALRHNVEKNAFAEVVTLRSEAAGKEKGQLSFHLGPEEQTGWGGLVHGDAKSDEVTVPVVTLDDEFKDVPFIDVLKVDTEGADTWVLEGACELIRQQRIKNIFFEEHKNRMAQLDIKAGRATQLLESLKYKVHVLSGGGNSVLTEYSAFPMRS
jgi:FkbM family methyltransferase